MNGQLALLSIPKSTYKNMLWFIFLITFTALQCTVLGEIERCSLRRSAVCALTPNGEKRDYRNECYARQQGSRFLHSGSCRTKKLTGRINRRGCELLGLLCEPDRSLESTLFGPNNRLPSLASLEHILELGGHIGNKIPRLTLEPPAQINNIVELGKLQIKPGNQKELNVIKLNQRSFSLNGRSMPNRKSCGCPKMKWYTTGCDGTRYLNSCEARCRSGGVRKNGKCNP